MPKKVLLAVDGSEGAEAAAKWYLESIANTTDEIIVAYISEIPWPIYSNEGGHASALEQVALIQARVQTTAQNIKHKYTELVQSFKMTCTFINIEGGSPGELLCTMAEKHSVSLIVMGCRGLGKIRRTIFGSVSHYVLHHAQMPVLVYSGKKKNK